MLSVMANRPRHLPVWMLVLACLFWGMGFSWAKNVGDAINVAAGLPSDAAVGPLTGLAIRFTAASFLWMALVPACWRGWTWQTTHSGVAIGCMLSLGLILQHIGLGLSDESVIAFLTNLTVIFVPLWVLVVTRRRPRTVVLIAVPVALLGMALLAGLRSNAASGLGAWWGVACAAAFAAEILLLDRLGRGESPARIALLLFVTAAVSCGVIAALLPGFGQIRWRVLAGSGLWWEIVPLTLLTTVAAFALMAAYQPKVDPTRAAVIYLCEPLFAAAFAWFHNSRTMSADAIAGALLILAANVIAELPSDRIESPH